MATLILLIYSLLCIATIIFVSIGMRGEWHHWAYRDNIKRPAWRVKFLVYRQACVFPIVLIVRLICYTGIFMADILLSPTDAWDDYKENIRTQVIFQ